MRYRRKSHRRLNNLKLILVLSLLALAVWLVFNSISRRAVPIANAIATIEAKNQMNRIINDTIAATVMEGDIVTSDFYNKTEDADGMITSLAVNTVLVNALCAEVADNITGGFMESGAKRIDIPVGMLTGIDILANLGPNYSVSLSPRGNAEVDYETRFEAVGINQINFQVWLNVSTAIRIVNPLQSEQVLVERKVALVNTVFSGRVPENFIGGLPVDVVK